jgi:hypothetical protein
MVRFVYGVAAATRSVTWTSPAAAVAAVKSTVVFHFECGIADDHFAVAIGIVCGFAVAATTVFATTATIFTADCAAKSAVSDITVQVTSTAVDSATCSALENENSCSAIAVHSIQFAAKQVCTTFEDP